MNGKIQQEMIAKKNNKYANPIEKQKQVRKLSDFDKYELREYGTNFILDGGLQSDFVKEVTTKYNISKIQAHNYYNICLEAIQKASNKNLDVIKKSVNKRLEDLYKLSLSDKDYKTALAVLKEISYIWGIGKINLDINGGVTIVQLPNELLPKQNEKIVDTELILDEENE